MVANENQPRASQSKHYLQFLPFFQVLCCRNAAHSCSDSFEEWVVLGSGWYWTATWADGGFWGCLCRETTAELFSFSGLLIHPFVSDKHVWKFGLFLDMPNGATWGQADVSSCCHGFCACKLRQAPFILQLLIGLIPHPMICMASIFPAINQFQDSLPICASVRQEKAKLLRYHAREINNRRHVHSCLVDSGIEGHNLYLSKTKLKAVRNDMKEREPHPFPSA